MTARWPGLRRVFRLPATVLTVRDDVDAELDFHIQGRIEELVAAGMPRSDAEAEARRRFGDYDRIEREVARLDRNRHRRLTVRDRCSSLAADLRYAARSLARQPLYAAVVVGTLTLGVGTTAAIFHAVDRVILHPLPYPDADRIVFLGMKRDEGIDMAALTASRFQFWHDHNRVFDGLATWTDADALLDGDDNSPPAHVMQVSSEYLRVTGTRVARGRPLTDADYGPGAASAALITDAFWQARFARREDILGTSIRLDSTRFTIVGVLPASFDVVAQSTEPDVLVPLVFTAQQLASGGANYTVIGRLRGGMGAEQVDADMGSVFDIYRTMYPEQVGDIHDMGVAALTFRQAFAVGLAPTLWILLGATGLVLLLACANVANIVLARTITRQREFAVRTALGAGRGRIVWQIVLEMIVLGGASAGLATVASLASVRGVVGLAHQALLRDSQLRLDGWVVVYIALIAVGASLVVGLGIALLVTRADLTKSLAGSTRSGGVGSGRPTLRGALVTLESALAMVLLAGAGLLISSFAHVLNVDGGFRRDGIYTATIPRAPRALSGATVVWQFDQRVLTRLRATPGITAGASTATLPLTRGWNIPTTVEGRDDATQGATEWRAVSPGYFRTMDIPILSGRDVAESDDERGPPVVLVSKAYASRFFPGENPIGRRILVGAYRGQWRGQAQPAREIIGVVSDLRDASLEQAQPRSTIWLPQAQTTGNMARVPSFLVRANDPRVATSALRGAITGAEPGIAAVDVAAMSDIVTRSLSSRRFALVLMTTFAAIALVLTCVGIYGVASYSVSQRTQEIGVRMALGAEPGSVVALVVRQGIRPTVIGLVIGVGAALLLSRVIAGMLFGIGPRDPVSIGVVAVVLLVVGGLATYVPARRASRLDPVAALRAE